MILIFSLFIRSGDDDRKMAGYIDNDDDLDLVDDDIALQTAEVRCLVYSFDVIYLALLSIIGQIGICHSASCSS